MIETRRNHMGTRLESLSINTLITETAPFSLINTSGMRKRPKVLGGAKLGSTIKNLKESLQLRQSGVVDSDKVNSSTTSHRDDLKDDTNSRHRGSDPCQMPHEPDNTQSP
jgi:hypothetical protein